MQNRWNATAYANYSKGQEIWAKELISKMNLQGDESILDIGCGDGKITNLLADLVSSRVTGIDLSQNMIELAKERFKKPDFIQMGAQNLKFDSEFDIVFSNAALHWARDHEAILKGIYRALKPNGRILLQMGGKGNAAEVFEAISLVQKKYAEYFEDFTSPYTFHDEIYYTGLLEETGFREYDARLIPKEMIHQTREDFKGWLETTWFPYLNRLPDTKKEEFLNKLIETYLETKSLHKDDPVPISMIRLEVKAQK